MQNDNRQLVRVIGKAKGGIGEIIAVWNDGTKEHFIGNTKTGQGLRFIKKPGGIVQRIESDGYEGRRLAS